MPNFLSFPTRKLKGSLLKINTRLKDLNINNDDLKVFGVSNIQGVTITGKESSVDLDNYIYVSDNQFVYNPYRVNVGSLGLTPNGFSGLVSPAYEVFKTKDDISSEFLYFYLKSSLGMKLIRWYGDRGGVRAALRFKDLENIDFPDLSNKEQESALKKIKQINVFLSEYNMSLNKKVEEMFRLRQLILQEAVQGKLALQDPNDEPASELLNKVSAEREKQSKKKRLRKDKLLPLISKEQIPHEVPKGWVWSSFDQVASIASNLVNPIDFLDYPHIAPDNVEKNRGKLIGYRTIREDRVTSAKHRFFPGQIIYSKIRPNLNKLVIVEFEGLCSADMYPIISFINREYLFYYMLSKTFLKQSTKGDTRIAMPKINKEELSRILVPVPPYNEQKRIVEKVDKLMKLCVDLEKKINDSQKNADLLMQAVFQEAFNSAKS